VHVVSHRRIGIPAGLLTDTVKSEIMPDEALLRKLLVKPGTGVTLLNPPEELKDTLSIGEAKSSIAILFVRSIDEINKVLPILVKDSDDYQHLWIAFPKKTSKIKSDLSRDVGWDIIKQLGYGTAMLISINDDWSAFRIKPINQLAPRAEHPHPAVRADLIVPPDLELLLADAPEASVFFQKLSYSCRKEYLTWIESAKRAETREKRLRSTVEMLARGKRTPVGN
jgi:hypothetical protein